MFSLLEIHPFYASDWNCKVKVVRIFGSEFTVSSPLCNCIMRCEMLNPMPLPFGFVEKNGVKIADRSSCGIPGPLSAIII